MSEILVGKEVLSYCGKCKLVLAHIVVSMKNETTIGKVKCNTCEATHAYKDPSKVKSKKTKKKTTKKSGRSDSTSVADVWMKAINNATAKSKPYSMNEKFSVDDIIDHQKLGPGVVERSIDNNKIQVIFRHDIKILIHNQKK